MAFITDSIRTYKIPQAKPTHNYSFSISDQSGKLLFQPTLNEATTGSVISKSGEEIRL